MRAIAALTALLLFGCATPTPKPYLADISDVKAEVRVPNEGGWDGPKEEDALAAATAAAEEHCQALGKRATLVAEREDTRKVPYTRKVDVSAVDEPVPVMVPTTMYRSESEYVFLYRCDN